MNWLRWLWNWGEVVQPRVLPTISVSATVYEAIPVSATVYDTIEVSSV